MTPKGRTDLSLDPCLNCGDPREGSFCPTCGQRKVEVRASVRQLMQDVVSDQFSLDGRLPRTLIPLFFRPGRLTREYLAGHVAPYVRPFRLYLFSSILFFVLLGALGLRGLDELSLAPQGQVDQSPAAAVDAGATVDAETVEVRWGWGPDADIRINTGFPLVDAMLRDRMERLVLLEPVEAIQEVVRILLRYVPTLLFLLLPVFAAILSVLYVRQRRYYLEHFIFVLHTHAFLFSVFSFLLIMSALGQEWLAGPLQLAIWVYLFLALRRVYGQGRRKTALKLVVFSSAYFLVLAFSLPFLLAVSFILWN